MRKDNFKDVTAAFGLDQKGTIADLISHCHKHMETHPELATNPCFAKIFIVQCTCVHRIQVTGSAVHGPSSSLSVLTPLGPYANLDMFPPPNLLPCPNSHILPLFKMGFRGCSDFRFGSYGTWLQLMCCAGLVVHPYISEYPEVQDGRIWS